jgi:hypothetical protein
MTWSKVNIHTSYNKLPALIIIHDDISDLGYLVLSDLVCLLLFIYEIIKWYKFNKIKNKYKNLFHS